MPQQRQPWLRVVWLTRLETTRPTGSTLPRQLSARSRSKLETPYKSRGLLLGLGPKAGHVRTRKTNPKLGCFQSPSNFRILLKLSRCNVLEVPTSNITCYNMCIRPPYHLALPLKGESKPRNSDS